MLCKNAAIIPAMSSFIPFDYLLTFGNGNYKRNHTIVGRRADAGHGLRGGCKLEDAAAAPALSLMVGITGDTSKVLPRISCLNKSGNK